MQSNLINFPPDSKEYVSPEHIIFTISTDRPRHYTFGGPIWIATLYFVDSKIINVIWLSPLKKPFTIKLDKVKSVTMKFLEPKRNKR